MRKGKTVTVQLSAKQMKKLDSWCRRFWPSLSPKQCRATAIRVLLQMANAKSETFQ